MAPRWTRQRDEGFASRQHTGQELIAGEVLCLSGCLQAWSRNMYSLEMGQTTLLLPDSVCPECALPSCTRHVPLCQRWHGNSHAGRQHAVKVLAHP